MLKEDIKRRNPVELSAEVVADRLEKIKEDAEREEESIFVVDDE